MDTNLQDKIVLAHRGLFNQECHTSYQENSKEACKVSSDTDYIDIIEIDVRKSKNGILYCYHGSFLQYYFLLNFSRNFDELKRKYHVDTLSDVLDVITENKILVLDIKNDSITREDIFNALKGRKFKEIILGSTSPFVSSLDRFYNMPEGFSKILNGKIFCSFYSLKKLREKNYKYFEALFPFQVTKRMIDRVKKNGMQFRVAGLFFRNKKSYWNTINKYNIEHVSTDFI